MKKTFTKQFEWVMGMTGSTSCFSPTRRLLLLLCLILVGAVGAKAQSDVKFNEGVRYSQWVIDSRLGDFYGNTNDFGFTTYNRDLTVKKNVTKWKNGSTNPYIDYVPGLVAKATIEAAEYYKNFDWAKPWFKSVEWYGNKCTVPTSPDNLDAINASKMYFGIYALANGSFSSNAESTTASTATTQLGNALSALKHYNKTYAFPASTTLNGKDIAGGWYHKSSYSKQMWLDGQYMGPALLAQLINGYLSYSAISDNDWDLIAKQFTIVWEQCWDDKEKLLYHAFSSEPLSYWTSDAEIWTTAQADKTKWTSMDAAGHSSSFWGRAEGWYFLALVDVLEQMPTTNNNYNTLKSYLTTLADGIKARQDATSGCWYQLVGKDGSYTASYYNGNSANPKTNYLESSCTAIFAAAYLKAVRLGLLSNDYKTIGENAYKGAVAQFMKQRTDGTVDLLGCCKSAGVGTAALGEEKFRDGSNAYYLHGYDVAPTSTTSNYYTEGKVMGAFIMAATEYERANEKDIRFSYDLAPSYTLEQGGSITAEALGSGTITYQWFNASDNSLVFDGQTFAPTESGTYYCKATSGSTEIQTSTTTVTVSENVASTDVLQVTTNGQTFDLTQTNIQNYDYASVSRTDKWDNKTIDNTSYSLFNMSSTDRTITLNVSGASSFEVKVQNKTNGRKYDISVTDANGNTISSSTITHTGKGVESSGVINTNSTGVITIKLTGGGASVYPYQIIFYTGSTDTSGYTINYSTSVGTAPDSKSNITTLTADELPTLSATGYTFDGWYFDEAFTNQATAGATISGNTTLYAKWTKNTYTVTAIAENGNVTINNGSNPIESGSQVEHGTSLTFTASPNAGYEFSSWSVTGTTGTENSNVYTIESLTQATTVTANFTATSSGGGETGGSVTGDVIYFTSGKTSSDEKVLKVNVGNATKVSVNYGDDKYTNGVKMESSTDITLTLKAESKVTFVFDTASKKFKIDETSYTTNESGTYTITLAAGTYKIKKDDTGVALVAVDIQPTGPSMSISTQPQSADYVKGATVTPLSVGVTFNNAAADDYNKSYLWYKNTENSTTGGVEVGREATYTPTLSNTAGTTYYYCVVTATLKTDDSKTLTATSNVAAITVSEPYIEFTTQPTGAQYYKGETATELSAGATTNISGATISYKWYSNGTESTTGATEKGTGTSYTPSTESAGTTYYYCVASVVNGSETLTATSDIVSVEVVGKLYSRKVTSSDTAPQCNESWYITDDTENDKLVKMTFGGWKWGTNEAKNDHSYVKPNTTSTVITDSWEGPAKQAKVTALDGYEYAISGKNDAVHEDKTATTNMYGSTRYGWFVSPERENGITTKSYPYTLPVRGAYMTFEPTKNGTLTVYLLQNGAWNSDSNNDIIPGQFRMHAFQITNQRGLVLEEFAPQYKITVNQKVMDGYTCSQWQTDPGEGNYDETSKDISKWKEFWTLDDDERKAVKENWANGTNESQTIIKLKNGSFLAIQKAIVKYQFHVTGNETYYLFSNFSKLGFAGASFQPDDVQPIDETTFSGDNSLSDTKAYTQIKKEENGNIGDTGLTNYKYTIGGEEVGKVDGVFIPQFKAITLKRTFKPNQWTTLTLPFNLTEEEVQKIFGDGTQLIQLNNATVNSGCAKLTFIYHEIQNVLPGHPYLIKPTLTDITNDANVNVTKENNTITDFTVYNKCINPMIEQTVINCGAYTFKGVPGYSTPNENSTWSVDFKENDIFVSDGDGKMYVSAGSSYGKGYRAWFKYNDGISASGKINSISLAIDNPGDDDDNVVTTIDMVDVDPDVFNALGIATGVYNLNGQKVSDDMRSLPKGIYIVNGKKIVRK